MMGRRPLDFFGFEDYTGGDPQEDIDRIAESQKAWDEEFSKLNWLQKLVVSMFAR